MLVFILLKLAAVLYQVQCRPSQANGPGSDILQLIEAKTSSASNFPLEPILPQIENFEDKMSEYIRDLIPLFNFKFNTDSDNDETDEDNYDDQTILKLLSDYTYIKDRPESSLDKTSEEKTPKDSSQNDADEVKEENKGTKESNSSEEPNSSGNDSKEASKSSSKETSDSKSLESNPPTVEQV